ncbi:MAG: hypothetical protein WCP85_31365 [Mariniphaga sp.]
MKRQVLIDSVNDKIRLLPDDKIKEINVLIDQLIFKEKVEEGLRDSEDGKVTSNEDVKTLIDNLKRDKLK